MPMTEYILTIWVSDAEGNGLKSALHIAFAPEQPEGLRTVPDWTALLGGVPITQFDGAPASEAGGLLRRHFERLSVDPQVDPLVVELLGWTVQSCALFPQGTITVDEEYEEGPIWTATS